MKVRRGHEVEAVLAEIETFTSDAMAKALADEKRGLTLIAVLSVIILVIGVIFGYALASSVVKPVRHDWRYNELAKRI